MNEVFSASRLKDMFTPDQVVLNEKGVSFRTKRLLSGSDNFVFYSDISGVDIDSGLFFATIRILPRARPEIVIKGFSKGDAERIKELILERA
ncbi:hypothetical protein QNI19_00485 [Cytophagaceae bacterium DM2B3-1]|uniref:Uncharacterized protein n=2 Tax=Xanthocytophaga TaxID=3078918 RepID=A0AAE3QRL5_9BACT|nr:MULTISPECIES: hypothetical protein [Xanthocytophaga]MDJ1470055.1 hypothetical protein [Xanthocytophaga flavus]MDJ1481403.1 hypothetical protein [Xanthocytophaga flavus]MDJ1491381.1 hypothetical protein [Xanthocytophaga flavus]MDJ1502351.1 hypothetical protein [Xanthocytophaga agilis]